VLASMYAITLAGWLIVAPIWVTTAWARVL
jgi:hypothetical protein